MIYPLRIIIGLAPSLTSHTPILDSILKKQYVQETEKVVIQN